MPESRTYRLFKGRSAPARHRTAFDHPFSAKEWARRIRKQWTGYALSIGLIAVGVYGITTISISGIPTSLPAAGTTEPIASSRAALPYTLPKSLPTHLEIPDIAVSTDLIQLGKNDDGTLETPSDYAHAGWYKYSPTPGEIGPSIITGHVDNYLGPAVFFNLQNLKPGQRISINRERGDVATFEVDEVKAFSQEAFPTDEVYGNIDHAGLRLITCGGTYNPFTGHYSHNVVVYASLIKNP